MRPFYRKGTEDGTKIFAKVVITKSVATVDILMCSPDNTWTTKKKPYDLTKAEEKREYSNFLERNFSSSFKEFDTARKQMREQSGSSSKEIKSEPPVSPEDIVRMINESRNKKT